MSAFLWAVWLLHVPTQAAGTNSEPRASIPAAASWSLCGRVGMAAVQTGATTRAPAPEIGIGLRWQGERSLGLSFGYRGSWRSAGNHIVGAFSTIHRPHVGLHTSWAFWGVAHAGIEIGLHPRIRTVVWRGRRTDGRVRTSVELGVGVDGWIALQVTERIAAAAIFTTYPTWHGVDFAATLGAETSL